MGVQPPAVRPKFSPVERSTAPQRFMDCFCVRTAQGTGIEIDTPVGVNAAPVALVGRLVPSEVSGLGDRKALESVEHVLGEASKKWAVVSVTVSEWFVDVSDKLDRPSTIWILGEGAWYRLLRPSQAYADIHASFMDRAVMSDLVCDMIKKQPLTTVHEMIGKFVVGNLTKETQAARALTLLDRAGGPSPPTRPLCNCFLQLSDFLNVQTCLILSGLGLYIYFFLSSRLCSFLSSRLCSFPFLVVSALLFLVVSALLFPCP